MKPRQHRGQTPGRIAAALARGRAMVADSTAALLLETIIAVSVFVMIAGATLTGATMIQRGRATLERQAIAENLLRNQMEYVFSLPYKSPTSTFVYSFPTPTSIPSGYSVSVVATTTDAFPTDGNIKKIVVTVKRDAETVLQVETFRTNK